MSCGLWIDTGVVFCCFGSHDSLSVITKNDGWATIGHRGTMHPLLFAATGVLQINSSPYFLVYPNTKIVVRNRKCTYLKQLFYCVQQMYNTNLY